MNMANDLNSRINKMFGRDRLFATGIVVLLWVTVFFVMLMVRPYIPTFGIELACWCGAGVLLLFNTASIFAMLRHYAEDKEHIYAVDIRHLDAGR